ncbi:hypothetical protein [Bradyrhizobium glycinis]|uniref:hypothetical protein n=1 Tax=Bradyrhizobium glycinis TaxID=2751812 RepID=UPI0018D61E08|nr:hypothetical protein [Bradyrhizobium glycinis]MBH5371468.1 hypothetical protein [Bradyrhizobium glycinis]
MTVGQTISAPSNKSDIVVKYLKDNPAERSDVAALATYKAMTAAFACKKIPK